MVNVARGLVIDQDGFYDVLKNGKIAGAGIDTFARDENMTETREDIMNFARLSNVIATPHVAYRTIEAKNRLGSELIADIESIIFGKPINEVN